MEGNKLPMYFDNHDQAYYDYSPFFEWIREKGISIYRLRKNSDFPEKGVDRMKKGENLTIETLVRIMYVVEATDLAQIVRITFRRQGGEDDVA
ncbi:MAG: helix-turn-helix transcriptional regulator [Erysipelotrichaceae bacterium]|jgi:hypothetical protein|nr:helix-turn-helix transcriptional regulator [Erysipelotrichaceae bacterium]